MKALTLLLTAVFVLSACGGGGGAEGFSYDGPVTKIDWSTNAMEHRGDNGMYVGYECDPNPDQVAVGSVWGTGTYSDDSSVCQAGVHAGAITYENGGVVVIQIAEGQESYTGSEQNGVESSNWPSWAGSFVVMQ